MFLRLEQDVDKAKCAVIPLVYVLLLWAESAPDKYSYKITDSMTDNEQGMIMEVN